MTDPGTLKALGNTNVRGFELIGRTLEGTGVAGNNASAACYAYSVSRGVFAGIMPATTFCLSSTSM